MSISSRYTDFGTSAQSHVIADEDDSEALEDLKLTAFEVGYQAGWEDGVKAQTSENAKAVAEIAQRLQDMSFTYHEVHTKLMFAMKPLLESFVTKLMPDVADQCMYATLVHEITKLIEDQAEGVIEVVISPYHLPVLQDVLDQSLELPFKIAADPGLTHGMMYLRVGSAERQIDLDAVRTDIAEALAAFFHEIESEKRHG